MTLRDRLSRLTLTQALKLLGPRGKTLLAEGGAMEIDLPGAVELRSNVLRVRIDDEALVSIVEDESSVNKMHLFCSECEGVCAHVGAALSLVLEEKSALGLAEPKPQDEMPAELSEQELVAREIMRRQDRSEHDRLSMASSNPKRLWTDYAVTSAESGKTYRVALRGLQRGESFCGCPDFRKNGLGTCKHIMFVSRKARASLPATASRTPFVPTAIAVYVAYGAENQLRIQTPPDLEKKASDLLAEFLGKPVDNVERLSAALSACAARDIDVVVYPDAEDLITMELHRRKLQRLVDEMRQAPQRHPLRSTLLKVELLPYQLDGIAFVAGRGRAVLADDMGLGKTIQGVGMAELLARECRIGKTLVVCPASVKSQWRAEIIRFSERSCQIVSGGAKDRFGQYQNDAFFTICNYEQVLRDVQAVESVAWDLIILDEGQRIKNWEAKTSRAIKALRSRFALVLSGTPLENRLEELYSVVEFIDDRRLGPDFRFHHRHAIADERGRIVGYKNLDALRALLAPVLLRRTRDQVMKQLPPRTNDIIRVTPTQEQLDIHAASLKVVTSIVRKAFISEMDLLRMRKALLACRMVADSTFLVNKEEPAYSTKLERLAELLPRLAEDKERKVILFSEWTTMLDLIERTVLKPNGIRYVRLDGSVPQGKRAALVHEFQTDPLCTFFITTNAGATGLNLQAANTVVNVDLPWNPAILEQRIGRAHRMGQKRPVHVYILVTEGTIEENMLKTLSAKKDLALAALDVGSEVSRLDLKTGIDDLKRRLEQLLGDKPVAPIDESAKHRVEQEMQRLDQRQRITEAGGNLLTAALSFLGTLAPGAGQVDPRMVTAIRGNLEQCITTDEKGGVSMTFRLPGKESLESLALSLAAFAGAAKMPG
jgi:superfamily II DNA or RNA helicase